MPRLGVVLAAGRSERLRSVTGGGSKALVRACGLTLLERSILELLRAGVEEVVVVVGYQAGPVAAVAQRTAPGRVHAALAEDWELGNGASLLAAERLVGPRDDLLVVVTMDHVFSEGALAALVAAGEPAVLVDDSPRPDTWEEGTRVRLRGSVAVAFGKQLPDACVDCGAFLLPREVFDCARRASATGEHSLAGALTLLAAARPLRAVQLPPGAWWQDVDTPADLQRVRRLLRRSLTKPGDGPVSRFVNRPLSTRLSVPLAALGLSPDVLSLLAVAAGALAAWLLASGEAVAGALAVHAASVLDGVDGEVARLRLRATPRGAFLDGLGDRLADAAVVGGLALWATDQGAGPAAVLLAVSATAGSMLSMASKDRAFALGLPPAPEAAISWLLGGRDGRLALVSVFAGLGLPVAALWAVSASSGASLLARTAAVAWRGRSR